MTGRVIAAWPSFALIAAYELLMRQVRCTAARRPRPSAPAPHGRRETATVPTPTGSGGTGRAVGRDLQQQAWRWADANRAADGSLPSRKAIAARFGRHERWGRLIKRMGTSGEFTESRPQEGASSTVRLVPSA